MGRMRKGLGELMLFPLREQLNNLEQSFRRMDSYHIVYTSAEASSKITLFFEFTDPA
jgi:hypothetical protein